MNKFNLEKQEQTNKKHCMVSYLATEKKIFIARENCISTTTNQELKNKNQ